MTISKMNAIYEVAVKTEANNFSNGDGYEVTKLNASKLIKDGLTKSQIKVKLKQYSKIALETIIDANDAVWSELAKVELQKTY